MIEKAECYKIMNKIHTKINDSALEVMKKYLSENSCPLNLQDLSHWATGTNVNKGATIVIKFLLRGLNWERGIIGASGSSWKILSILVVIVRTILIYSVR
jgi:hypothetical protein